MTFELTFARKMKRKKHASLKLMHIRIESLGTRLKYTVYYTRSAANDSALQANFTFICIFNYIFTYIHVRN